MADERWGLLPSALQSAQRQLVIIAGGNWNQHGYQRTILVGRRANTMKGARSFQATRPRGPGARRRAVLRSALLPRSGTGRSVPAQQRGADREAIQVLTIGLRGLKIIRPDKAAQSPHGLRYPRHLSTTCPLLVRTSMKLYRINCHVGLVSILIFEDWARSGSSPSASAQYISASFRVPAAIAQRFCSDRETSELFRLGPIILCLRLHGRHSGCGLAQVNVEVHPAVPGSRI
jgi:hypothetical protein